MRYARCDARANRFLKRFLKNVKRSEENQSANAAEKSGKLKQLSGSLPPLLTAHIAVNLADEDGRYIGA